MSNEEFNTKDYENQTKLKDKLMNNINFIAYLYKFSLISDQNI